VRVELEGARNSVDMYNNLDEKYQVTLMKLANAIYRDPSNFRSSEAVKFIDSLYSRYYDMQDMYG